MRATRKHIHHPDPWATKRRQWKRTLRHIERMERLNRGVFAPLYGTFRMMDRLIAAVQNGNIRVIT